MAEYRQRNHTEGYREHAQILHEKFKFIKVIKVSTYIFIQVIKVSTVQLCIFIYVNGYGTEARSNESRRNGVKQLHVQESRRYRVKGAPRVKMEIKMWQKVGE